MIPAQIQLVQTLGHLEFVLKHKELGHMRELSNFPSVLCPTRPGGKELVLSMIAQVLAMQPDAKFIHIGADEVSKEVYCNIHNSRLIIKFIIY